MTGENAHVGKRKNIVICCDGTGNKFIDALDAPDGNSNVVKLYTTLEVNEKQVAYYHPGVGTAGDPSARHWASRKWSVLKGLAFGAGFKNNVIDAYRYLVQTYADGDRVYLFGFSRGAYTVRALCGLLDGYGLLCPGNEGHIPYAWNEYVGQHRHREGKRRVVPNHRFKETFSRKGFRIHFIGIWDTVSSVGWITSPLRLYNIAQNPTIHHGRHAVSIDERRCFYRDNLWTPATEEQLKEVASGSDPEPRQDLLEVWFPGVHSDVGGSYPQLESGLSNTALEWMIEEAKKAGLCIRAELTNMVLGRQIHQVPDPDLASKIRYLKPIFRQPESSKLHKSLHGIWWLLELFPHRYYDKDDARERWRTPLGMQRRIPEGALIHASIVQRLQDPSDQYSPSNLKGGCSSLQPIQDPACEILYSYFPTSDPKPLLNGNFIRRGLMLFATMFNLGFVLLLGRAIAWLLRHR